MNKQAVQKNKVAWKPTMQALLCDVYGMHDLPEYFTFFELGVAGRATEAFNGARHLELSESASLEATDCEAATDGDVRRYTLTLQNDIVRVKVYYTLYAAAKTVRTYAAVHNISDKAITLEYAGSFAQDGFWKDDMADSYLYYASNGSYCEAQWGRMRVRDLGVVPESVGGSKHKFAVSNTGCWSTKNNLPMGILENANKREFFLWQIEANGSWEWELGNRYGGLSLRLSGPTLWENGWQKTLMPDQTFETVAASFTRDNSLNGVLSNITRYRRITHEKSNDTETMPIIFNEYMYAAWNNPTESNTRQIANAVANLQGVEYYVIDCGWHDEEDDAFCACGKWEESRTRYPSGLRKSLDYVRSLGMKVGLWLEPEVVGAEGDARKIWTDDCFFRKEGKPYVISHRYQLDFRNPKVTEKLNGILDRVIAEYGVEYVKLDYNIEPVTGPTEESDGHGDGLLEHCRAVNEWQRGISEKYPNLIVELCASGGNRLDWQTAKYANLLSTSDQTDYVRYAYIVSNMLSALLPEQAAVWSYPLPDTMQPNDITDEHIVFTMINGMLGRMHLSSRLDKLSDKQREYVREALAYYAYMTPYKRDSVPYLPCGFSHWGDGWTATGIRTEEKCFLTVYHMHGTRTVRLPLPELKVASVRAGYPQNPSVSVSWDCDGLQLEFTEDTQARLLEIDLLK